MYDRSPEFFRSINLREKHEVGLVFTGFQFCQFLKSVLISEGLCINVRRVPDVMLQELT